MMLLSILHSLFPFPHVPLLLSTPLPDPLLTISHMHSPSLITTLVHHLTTPSLQPPPLLSHLNPEKLAELVTEAGFEIIENRYIRKETVNYKEDLSVPRVFVQGRFVKPVICMEQKPIASDEMRMDSKP